MKTTLQILAIIIGTFALMFATSMLFSLEWVKEHWTRQGLVTMLMVVELWHGWLMYAALGKRLTN